MHSIFIAVGVQPNLLFSVSLASRAAGWLWNSTAVYRASCARSQLCAGAIFAFRPVYSV